MMNDKEKRHQLVDELEKRFTHFMELRQKYGEEPAPEIKAELEKNWEGSPEQESMLAVEEVLLKLTDLCGDAHIVRGFIEIGMAGNDTQKQLGMILASMTADALSRAGRKPSKQMRELTAALNHDCENCGAQDICPDKGHCESKPSSKKSRKFDD
jgi:hypothetical protein